MMMLQNILYAAALVPGAAFLIWFNIERAHKVSVKALILKAVTSVFFILSAVAASYRGLLMSPDVAATAKYSLLVLAGLVFGMLGDIWLDLKFIYPADNTQFTYAGFISFAIGHIFFISAILGDTALFAHPLYVVIPCAIALVFAIGVQLVQKPMGMVYGGYAAIVSVYTFILVLTTFLAGAAALYGLKNPVDYNAKKYIVFFIGAVFFLISDLILSGTYFGEGKNRPIDVVTNHVTYYIAQYLIAASILFI